VDQEMYSLYRNHGGFRLGRMDSLFRLRLPVTPCRSQQQREDGNSPKSFDQTQFHAHYGSDEA